MVDRHPHRPEHAGADDRLDPEDDVPENRSGDDEEDPKGSQLLHVVAVDVRTVYAVMDVAVRLAQRVALYLPVGVEQRALFTLPVRPPVRRCRIRRAVSRRGDHGRQAHRGPRPGRIHRRRGAGGALAKKKRFVLHSAPEPPGDKQRRLTKQHTPWI